MNKEALEKHASELLSLGRSLAAKPEYSQVSQLLSGSISLTALCYGPDSAQSLGLIDHRDRFISADRYDVNQVMGNATQFTIGVIENLLSELEAGFIGNIQQQIAGEVLGDFIELAKDALSKDSPGRINVAAVLIAASYEDTLRRMGSQLAGITDEPKLEEVQQILKQKGLLRGSEVSAVKGFLKFRNDALHANWKNIQKTTVHSCLTFVEQLLLKHFS